MQNAYSDTQNLIQPAAVQRLMNVLAAVEFLHGHGEAMSLAERLALNETEQSKPEEPKPEPEAPKEPSVKYFPAPQRAASALVAEGSVLRRKGDYEEYVVVQKDRHFAKLHKPYDSNQVVVNLARSHNWLLVGEVAG